MTTTQWARIMAAIATVLLGIGVVALFTYADPHLTIWAVLAGGTIASMGVLDGVRAIRTGGGRH